MRTILTLTLGEFNSVHDILSLTIAAMGAATLFFLLSRNQVKSQLQPAVLAAGLVTFIGCYYAFRLFNSWNEAFELAGNSYAASGHFFHESYRYADWVLTMPLLLVALVLALSLPTHRIHFLLSRLINAALATILFSYLGKITLGAHGMVIPWLWWILEIIPLGYIIFLVFGTLSDDISKKPEPIHALFLSARNLLLLALLFYPLATLVNLCFNGIGSTGLVAIAIGTSIADIISKCGVGFYVYRLAKQSNE